MENADNQNEEVDALCKECGYAFKAYVDRILSDENAAGDDLNVVCPVCGCTDCAIGK